MSNITFPTAAASEQERNFYNRTRSRSGFCTLDTYLTSNGSVNETALGLYVSVAGNVVLENIDGTTAYLPALSVGVEHKYKFKRVLTNGTVDGNSVTTSATGIIWVGGEH